MTDGTDDIFARARVAVLADLYMAAISGRPAMRFAMDTFRYFLNDQRAGPDAELDQAHVQMILDLLHHAHAARSEAEQVQGLDLLPIAHRVEFALCGLAAEYLPDTAQQRSTT